MKDTAQLITALTGLAWPVLIGLVVWRLFPSLKKLVESRGFTVKVGQAELTVQEFSDHVVSATADLQQTLAAAPATDRGVPDETAAGPAHPLSNVLWVDDKPQRNVYEAAQLERLGVRVRQVTSTAEGLSALASAERRYDAVITDMARVEPGGVNRSAGIDLIRQARDRGYRVPVFVYARRHGPARRDEILAAGGDGVAASTTELFHLLRTAGRFPESAED